MGRYDFLIYLHVEKFLKAHTVTCTEADTVSGDKWENDVSEGQMVVAFSAGLWSRLLESSVWVWLCGKIRDFPGMDMEVGVRKGRQPDKTGKHSMAKCWQTVQDNNPARTECWHSAADDLIYPQVCLFSPDRQTGVTGMSCDIDNQAYVTAPLWIVLLRSSLSPNLVKSQGSAVITEYSRNT